MINNMHLLLMNSHCGNPSTTWLYGLSVSPLDESHVLLRLP